MGDQLRRTGDKPAAGAFGALFLVFRAKVGALLRGPAIGWRTSGIMGLPARGAANGEAVALAARLSADELEIIRLCFVEGLSEAEIAARLALPIELVNLQTRQAFHKLRCAMESRS